MKKLVILLGIIIVVLSVFLILSLKNKNGKNDRGYTVKKIFIGNDVSLGDKITCTYPQLSSVNFNNGEVSHVLNKPEENPMVFTFSNLTDPKEGQLSYLDSTRTITTIPIYKIREDAEKVVYIDGIGQGNYLTTHTIFKIQGVSIYTKAVSLLGIPFGSLAMGTCVGY